MRPAAIGDAAPVMVLEGAQSAFAPAALSNEPLTIADGRIAPAIARSSAPQKPGRSNARIDLSGYLLMPGFVNAHDHLEFSLFPRLGTRHYQNYVEWGDDIHLQCADVIASVRAVPKEIRLWWGGIRNLLCGATTVCHHNPFWPELERCNFPVRVLKEYGWGHSLALGGNLAARRQDTPRGWPFIVHACEGVDQLARNELWELDCLGLVGADTVLVHGLAIHDDGAERIRQRASSLVLCPSSNHFLFGQNPDIQVLKKVERLAIGSDSPLTACGDLLDEIRYAIHTCGLAPEAAYRMVTTSAAAILRMNDGQGKLEPEGIADLIAVQFDGRTPIERLPTLSAKDVELVIVRGRVQLASSALRNRLPQYLHEGMEALSVDGVARWVRAPVHDLLRRTEKVLGEGHVRLNGRCIRIPTRAESEDAD